VIEIFKDLAQGSPEWFATRAGIPTASRFADVMAKGRGGAESLTRAKYLRQLAGEIITGTPTEEFTNPALERGKEMEAEAREHYAFVQNTEPELVGFVRNGQKGCSPDALIGSDGALEIKTKRADILIDVLLRDEFPPEHKAQCQGVLWVAEREFIDICCYWPRMPVFIKRAVRDNGYIANLAGEVDRFNDELAAIVERLRNYGIAE
jgi:hypothetical protein